jgi:hypothetical protein
MRGSYHLLLRVPRLVRTESGVVNIIDAHNELAGEHGPIWFAKFGAPPSAGVVDVLQSQIAEGLNASLILGKKEGGVFVGFSAKLQAIILSAPTAEMRNRSPAFYEEMHMTPSSWFCVEGPFQATDLGNYRLKSNKRPLVEVMRQTRTSLMLVERVEGI